MPFERDPKPLVVGELLANVNCYCRGGGCVYCQEPNENTKALNKAWAKVKLNAEYGPIDPAALRGKTIGEMSAQELKDACDNIKAARTAWELSDRSVPFPDYWAGWQAATLLINERAELEASKLREATLAGQLNAALQPTLDGEGFKKLRLENAELKTTAKWALSSVADSDTPTIGSPRHEHKVAGKWDSDGSQCEECAAFDKLRELIK